MNIPYSDEISAVQCPHPCVTVKSLGCQDLTSAYCGMSTFLLQITT